MNLQNYGLYVLTDEYMDDYYLKYYPSNKEDKIKNIPKTITSIISIANKNFDS